MIIIISIATLINGLDNERYPPPVLLLSAIICCRSPVQGWLHTGPRPCIQPSPSPDTDLLHTITCHQTHRVQYTWRDVMSASSKMGNTRNISESETFPIERKSPQSRLLASVIRVLHQPRSVVLWHYCHYLHVSFRVASLPVPVVEVSM